MDHLILIKYFSEKKPNLNMMNIFFMHFPRRNIHSTRPLISRGKPVRNKSQRLSHFYTYWIDSVISTAETEECTGIEVATGIEVTTGIEETADISTDGVGIGAECMIQEKLPEISPSREFFLKTVIMH